ncbi:MAG: translation initiation factor IF-3 [Dehalococcoidia bacterium]|nr:translation initiation factor IF-3 [Dehalococcoidia bacterium]
MAVNQNVRAKEVRLIGEKGEQLGILSRLEALKAAQERGLDLVEIAPSATPPVCRLLDYGKYKYEQTKKERKAKKGQKVGLLKEVRFRPKIEDHDLQAKIRTVKKLLGEGNKVKISVRFRGREIIYPEMGWKVLKRVAEALKEEAVASNQPVKDRRSIALTFSAPSTKKSTKVKSNAKT